MNKKIEFAIKIFITIIFFGFVVYATGTLNKQSHTTGEIINYGLQSAYDSGNKILIEGNDELNITLKGIGGKFGLSCFNIKRGIFGDVLWSVCGDGSGVGIGLEGAYKKGNIIETQVQDGSLIIDVGPSTGDTDSGIESFALLRGGVTVMNVSMCTDEGSGCMYAGGSPPGILSASWLPLVNGQYDLGFSGIWAETYLDLRWRTLYLSEGINIGNLVETIFSVDNSGNVKVKGNINASGNLTVGGSLSVGNNLHSGLSAGDINVSTIYYDTLSAKSPIFLCSDNWCSINFPEYQKTLWIDKNQDWTINSIIYEGQSYTKQEFWNTICQINEKTQNICLKLNNKLTRLQDKYDCTSSGYIYDNGNCYKFIKNSVTYEEAVTTILKNKTKLIDSICKKLDENLNEETYPCKTEIITDETYLAYVFREGCGWDKNSGYYCYNKVLK